MSKSRSGKLLVLLIQWQKKKKTGPGDGQLLPSVKTGSSWARSSSEFLKKWLCENTEKTTSNYSLSWFILGLFDTFLAVSSPLDSQTTVSTSCRNTSSPLTLKAGTLGTDADVGGGGAWLMQGVCLLSGVWVTPAETKERGVALCLNSWPRRQPLHPSPPNPPVIARGLRFDMRQPTVSLLNV